MKKTKKILLLICCLFSYEALIAQTISIELEVPAGIMKSGEGIEVRKTYDGSIFSLLTTLEKNQSGLWYGSFDTDGKPFEYKYVVVRPNGEEEFEGWQNRIFNPFNSASQIKDVIHFLGGEKLQRDVQLKIILTLDGLQLNDEPPAQVGVMGSFGDLSWELPGGVTLFTNTGANVWETNVSFPKGTQTDFPIKFVWQHQGVWYWEQLAGYVDHLLILDKTAREYQAEFSYNKEIRQVQAIRGVGVLVNQYAEAANRYGGTRNYEYYHAMQLVSDGDYTQAQRVYETYRSHYKESFNDDFHGYLTNKLSMNGQLDQALTVAEDWYTKEYDPYRKAYYKYLKGRLYLNKGRNVDSRREMEEVLVLAPEYNQEALRGYALYGIAHSYLQEEDTSLVKHAEEPLRELIREHPGEQMRRSGWEQLARLGEKKKDKKIIEEAMVKLQETGTERQKLESRIRWVERRVQSRDMIDDSTLVEDMQWLEWTIEEVEVLDRVKLLKADYFLNKGEKNKAMEVLFEVEGKGRNNKNAKQARQRLDGMDKDWKAKQMQHELKKEQEERTASSDSTGGH